MKWVFWLLGAMFIAIIVWDALAEGSYRDR
jgi:hypothetical protein